MKKTLLTLTLTIATFFTYAQCTTNAIYQDSVYNIWPDTIVNLPYVTWGAPYYTQIDLKTPTTLIEAASGDSSMTTIDTLGNSYYVGNWPVDSMIMVETIGAPSGIILDCNTINCVYEGNAVGCANVYGTTTDPVGIYPITIVVNVYTHGEITIFGIAVPVETDLYAATGAYENIEGYNIIVNSTTGLETFHQDDFALFQNSPNPFSETTSIKFNSMNSEKIVFRIFNLLGEEVDSQIIYSQRGVNTINVNTTSYSEGMYLYSINNGKEVLTKRMIIKN